MRTLADKIRHTRTLLREAASSYESRVDSVAQRIVGKEYTRSELEGAIELHAEALGITELRLKGNAWKTFVADVKKRLGELGWRAKAVRTAKPKPSQEELKRIARQAAWAIGENFPDGDPYDAITGWATANGYSEEEFWQDVWPKVRRHFKEETGCDDIHEYRERLLQDTREEEPEAPTETDYDEEEDRR